MRAFVIADASKRKARPLGALFWEASATREQGRFSLELSSKVREDDLPLSVSFCVHRPGMRATLQESEEWVRSRIVPPDRHNIAEVLRENGLADYNEVVLLAACRGRSSDDDLLVYEVKLTAEFGQALKRIRAGNRAYCRADALIDAVTRVRKGSTVEYALVPLPGPEGASRRIGSQIRQQRLAAGLTQAQLACSAGVQQAVVSRVESGAGNPTVALLEEMASALGCSLRIDLAK